MLEVPNRIAVLLVLQDSSDESFNTESQMLKRVKDAAVVMLRESGLSTASAQTLYSESVVVRCAHWEPSWASARRAVGGVPPPSEASSSSSSGAERHPLWALLAWRRSYNGPQDSVSGRAHRAVAEALAELANEAGTNAPLVVVAQGLGCLLSEAHFACLAEAWALPEARAEANGSALTRGGGLVASADASPLERGATLHTFWALGSPIALWLDCLQAKVGGGSGGGGSEDAPWQRTLPFSPEHGLATVPSPLLGVALPEPLLNLGGRQHFWHRHDPMCSAPIADVLSLGASAVDVEVRLGGAAPPTPSDYLKAVDSERRLREAAAGGGSGRARKEATVPLGRHLASMLLGFSPREKTLFDRVVERRRSDVADTSDAVLGPICTPGIGARASVC